MTIPGASGKRHRIWGGWVAAALMLSACGDGGERAAMPGDDATLAQAAEDCLLMVWESQPDRRREDEDFDRSHDKADGGAISCATGTSPAQFEAALVAIRTAAKSRDKAQILNQIGIPMLYIDADGNRREMTPETIEAMFEDVFSDDMIALLERADLSAMTVIPNRGAYFELGSLWLVAEPGQRPRIVTVNEQALGEAAQAARREAEADNGKELEIAD